MQGWNCKDRSARIGVQGWECMDKEREGKDGSARMKVLAWNKDGSARMEVQGNVRMGKGEG